MSAFGALTDHWGLLGDGEPLNGKAKIIASSKEPVAQNRTDAEDESGDIAASAFHGNSAASPGDRLFTTSVTYQLLPGQDLDLNTIEIGELETGKLIDSVTVTTQNSGGNPTIELSGMLGTEAIIAPTDFLNTFTLPDLTITGAMRAQLLGFTLTEGKLTGSSFTASLTMEQQEDGVGEPVAHGIRGGTTEVTADLVRITTAPAVAVAAGFTLTKGPGIDEGQAAWHTTNATAAGTLTRDAP